MSGSGEGSKLANANPLMHKLNDLKDKLARLQDQIEDDRRLIEVEREKVVSVKSQKDAVDKHVAECHRLLDRANKINTAGAQGMEDTREMLRTAVSAVIARVEQQMQEERELRQKMAAAEAAERLRNAQSEAFYAAIIFAERDDECAFRLHEALNFETLHEDVCRFFECETPPIPCPAQFCANI